MAKILVVDDEAAITRMLQLELTHEGYVVITAFDGNEGLNKALNENPDLIILDVMLPKISGTELLRRLRMKSQIPVIMLTAKDDISDKVSGLDAGADDYMTKPFITEELLARIRVALGRKDRLLNEAVSNDEIKFGDLKLVLTRHEAYYGQDRLDLTKIEYDLLLYLLQNKNVVFTRNQLLDKVWGYDYVGESNNVDVFVRYLRSKIDQKYKKEIISTVRGVGYVIKDAR